MNLFLPYGQYAIVYLQSASLISQYQIAYRLQINVLFLFSLRNVYIKDSQIEKNADIYKSNSPPGENGVSSLSVFHQLQWADDMLMVD